MIEFENYVITDDYESLKSYPNSIHKPKKGITKAKVLGKVAQVDRIKYKGAVTYLMEFQDEHRHRMLVNISALKKGNFRNPYEPTVFGVGYPGVGRHKVSINNRSTKCYDTWSGMLRRAYSEKCHKKFPTYIGSKVDPRWHNFQVFAEWYEKNYPTYPTHNDDGTEIKWQLDKDLLSEVGNKVYGPETCVFLPNKVNNYILKKRSDNTTGYTGVTYSKNRDMYIASISEFNGKTKKYLGRAKTAKEASVFHKEAYRNELKKIRDYLKDLGFDYSIYNKIVE